MFTTLITNWKLVLIAVLALLCVALSGVVLYERQVVKVKIAQLEKKDLEIKVLNETLVGKDTTIALMSKNIAEIKKNASRGQEIARDEATIAAGIQRTAQKPCNERSEENAKSNVSINNFFNGGVFSQPTSSNTSLPSSKLPETREASPRRGGH